MLTFLLALQLGVAQGAGATPPSLHQDSIVRARVDRATRLFQETFRRSWEEMQNTRPRLGSGEIDFDDNLRGLSLHCHFIGTSLRIKSHLITGSTNAQASCPMWYPPTAAKIVDERRNIDGALPPRARPVVHALRVQLRTLLDSAAAVLPGDARIAGQRVRFALDDGDVAGAAIGAAACSSDETQCGLLRALVLQRAGNIAASDSAFLWTAGIMSKDARCKWNDVRMLLEGAAREAYAAMTCDARAEFEARLWWLSDPLYIERGNERRAEHFARKTVATLHSPLEFDGRQHWSPGKGGEAVTETLVRYGWPSHIYWAGPEPDVGHDTWLLGRSGADTAKPYVVPEYSRDRLHTLPLAHALEVPFFQVAFDDWRLNAPRDGDDDEWWPVEHFARDRSRIEGLPQGQLGMLRRSSATRLVWAGDLEAKMLARADGDVVNAVFFQSRAIATIDSAGAFRGRVGKPLRVDVPMQHGVALVAVEIPGDTARPAARTRFGVEIPETLAALGGAVDVSQPLLFEPPAKAATVFDADSAVAYMFGTTAFTRERRLGVYWETYGVGARDTVQVELRMSREDRPGILERVGDALRIGSQDANRVDISWREVPRTSRAVQRMEGSVPVGMYSIVLDLSRLSRGTYSIEVTVKGARTANSVTSVARALVLK